MFKEYTQTAHFKNRGSEPPWGTAEFPVDDVKALLDFDPPTERASRVATSPTRPTRLVDILPIETVRSGSGEYMRETLYLSGAEPIPAGAAYAPSDFAVERVPSYVAKIGTYINATEEVFDDDEAAWLYLKSRLGDALRLRVDDSALLGAGYAPGTPGAPKDFLGILNTPGIQSLTLGPEETTDDAIVRAIARVQAVGQASADAVLMHPAVAGALTLDKDSTGNYVQRPFAQPILSTPFLDPDTILVGDFRGHAALGLRRDVSITVSNSHADNFTSGLLTVRADIRGNLRIYRAPAFAVITGEFPVIEDDALLPDVDEEG